MKRFNLISEGINNFCGFSALDPALGPALTRMSTVNIRRLPAFDARAVGLFSAVHAFATQRPTTPESSASGRMSRGASVGASANWKPRLPFSCREFEQRGASERSP